MKSKVSGILFDMDGTVLDSEGIWDETQIQFLEENDIIVTSNDLNDFKGLFPCVTQVVCARSGTMSGGIY